MELNVFRLLFSSLNFHYQIVIHDLDIILGSEKYNRYFNLNIYNTSRIYEFKSKVPSEIKVIKCIKYKCLLLYIVALFEQYSNICIILEYKYSQMQIFVQ